MNLLRRIGIVLLVVVTSSTNAYAQAETLTVQAVRGALVDAIARLDTALNNAAQNTKSVGVSLEGNARAVVADIDYRLGNKLTYTLDRLDSSERKLVQDAQLLTTRVQSGTAALIRGAGNEARSVLGEADIVAYDTLYSLPCRSQEPRVVYVKPGTVFADVPPREVSVRGNYLAFGDEPKVTIDGMPSTIIARNSNELRVRIPDSLFARLQDPRSVSIRFRPEARKRKLVLGLVCWSSSELVRTDLSAATVLEPPAILHVDALITPVTAGVEQKSVPFRVDVGDENCDANYSVDRNWCVENGWRLVSWSGPSQTSANCGSGVISTTRISDTCIAVAAKLQGCGYDNYLFAKNCKGRGWLNYNGALLAERDADQLGEPKQVVIDVPVRRQSTFVLKYPGEVSKQPKALKYSVVVTVRRGKSATPVKKVELSDVLPTGGGVTTYARDGQLVVDAETLIQSLY